MKQRFKIGGIFYTLCLDKNRKFKWEDQTKNLVVNSGINLIITSGIGTSYLGLTDGTPNIVAGDIMTSHTGWVEIVAYSESVRQTYNKTITGTTSSNSASKALFSINGSTTIGGIFLTSSDVKSGTAGTLIAAAAFGTGDKSVISGDLIYIQYDLSGTAV